MQHGTTEHCPHSKACSTQCNITWLPTPVRWGSLCNMVPNGTTNKKVHTSRQVHTAEISDATCVHTVQHDERRLWREGRSRREQYPKKKKEQKSTDDKENQDKAR